MMERPASNPTMGRSFQVLLTTESAVRTAEQGCTHAHRIKGPVEEPKEWTITSRQTERSPEKVPGHLRNKVKLPSAISRTV